jgi:hypothetical protein
MEAINWIQENWAAVLSVLTALVTLASAVSALTDTPKDDAVVSKLKRFIDMLALNVGKAKKK